MSTDRRRFKNSHQKAPKIFYHELHESIRIYTNYLAGYEALHQDIVGLEWGIARLHLDIAAFGSKNVFEGVRSIK